MAGTETINEILRSHKSLVKYAIIGLVALLVKFVLDKFIFPKKPLNSKKKSFEAKKVFMNLNLGFNQFSSYFYCFQSQGENKDLFEDNVVVDDTYNNYYHDVYLKNAEENVKKHIPYNLPQLKPNEMILQSQEFYKRVNSRRSCRYFSEQAVPREAISNCIRAAGTSPSGAHTQPWHFVAIYDKETREAVREIVEEEELINYEKRQGKSWLKDLEQIGTTNTKSYISHAPCIILVFKSPFHLDDEGAKHNNWYYEASVSISVGILLCALNNIGLVTVTSTPMNCGPALRALIGRPAHEKLAFLLPIGFPSADAVVPDFTRKPLEEIMSTV